MRAFYDEHWDLIDPTSFALYATIIFYIWTTLL
jgi:hypothetical protein